MATAEPPTTASSEEVPAAPEPNYDALCATCKKPIGDHTVRQLADCNADKDFHLPYRDRPGGPLYFKGLKGTVAGSLIMAAGWIDTDLGRVPMVQYIFTGPGPVPGSTQTLEPINLILDSNAFRALRIETSRVIDKAITAARRGRMEGATKL